MYQSRRFWQHKPRSRGGWGGESHGDTQILARAYPQRPARAHTAAAPHRPRPRSHTPPTHSRGVPIRSPGRSRSSRGAGASTAVECGGSEGACGYGDWRPTTGHGHRSIHRQACQIDELMMIIPLGPRPTLVKTPQARSTRLFSSWLSSQQKVWARDQRKREEKTVEEF